MALQTLGYDEPQIDGICKYIEEHDTIEGAPDLKDEHLPVFDCAFKAANGTRTISWQAHVGMMAAAQPFLSGAISKTVNMPADSTVEDIEQAYVEGWKLGLKALAIYRDGSKQSQPLATSKEGDRQEEGAAGRSSRPHLRPPASAGDAAIADAQVLRRRPRRLHHRRACSKTARPANCSSRWPRKAAPSAG